MNLPQAVSDIGETEMALWLIRAGKHGEDENTALDKGLAIILDGMRCRTFPMFKAIKR